MALIRKLYQFIDDDEKNCNSQQGCNSVCRFLDAQGSDKPKQEFNQNLPDLFRLVLRDFNFEVNLVFTNRTRCGMMSLQNVGRGRQLSVTSDFLSKTLILETPLISYRLVELRTID